MHVFQCMGKIFRVEIQRLPLKFHTKYVIYTLKDPPSPLGMILKMLFAILFQQLVYADFHMTMP